MLTAFSAKDMQTGVHLLGSAYDLMQCCIITTQGVYSFQQKFPGLLAQSVAYLATSPATKAGGWSLPELPPCPGKVAAMISMTCSTAVFSMKEHSCANSSSRPAGGVLLPDGFAGSCAVCFALYADNLQAEHKSCLEPHRLKANLLGKK